MTTSITSRMTAAAQKAARLAEKHREASDHLSTLSARLENGDEKVTANMLMVASAEVDRLATLNHAANANHTELKWLAQHLGQNNADGLAYVVADIMAPFGKVRVVGPDDDFDINDADMFISQPKPSQHSLTEGGYNLRTRTRTPGEPILNGLLSGEVIVFGRNVPTKDINYRIRGIADRLGTYLNQPFRFHVGKWAMRGHGEWTAVRVVGTKVYPSLPRCQYLPGIGSQDSLSALAELFQNRLSESFAEQGMEWDGSTGFMPMGTRTPIVSAVKNAAFSSDTTEGERRTIVAVVDIEAWRHHGDISSDAEVDKTMHYTANTVANAVICVGRVVDVSWERVAKGKQGNVYRITVTGVSRDADAA